ncbi:hypothetical protein [Streptomyces sp. MJP52]|uniref:hypothetical protein n=1 Tax=Streptomyces sp. MJP52 TaxID=2940555 RepID=UPI002475A853|nr:hypothetical protein [Streptomyces sp. MJP52]
MPAHVEALLRGAPRGGAVDHVQADARDRRRGPDPALGEPVPGRQGVVGPGRVAVARKA